MLCAVMINCRIGVYCDKSLQFIGCMPLEPALSFYVSFHDEYQCWEMKSSYPFHTLLNAGELANWCFYNFCLKVT